MYRAHLIKVEFIVCSGITALVIFKNEWKYGTHIHITNSYEIASVNVGDYNDVFIEDVGTLLGDGYPGMGFFRF